MTTKRATLESDADDYAWRMGRLAGANEFITRSQCPFPSGHPMAYSWQSGFIEGKAEKDHANAEKRPIHEVPKIRRIDAGF